MLSGTLRHNLDPFEQYDDATLNDALRTAGFFTLQADMDEGKITLDTQISSGGGSLSVSQRQILALAQAVVRGSKLLSLHEGALLISAALPEGRFIQSNIRTYPLLLLWATLLKGGR
jgi:ABC-type bacteriocin/lantibiotic exporter with double-glycine peptidase domain